jgi:hypothetical protein
LLLCNDKAVLGPWVNSKRLNVFTGAVVWVLVMLSIILTASVMYPNISGAAILETLGGGTALALVGYAITLMLRERRRDGASAEPGLAASAHSKYSRESWRMPPLDTLPPPNLSLTKRIWMGVLRGYLVVAVGLVVVKVVQMVFFA